MNKKRIIYPIIVEGRYDKIKVDSVFDAEIFVCDGFGVFNSKEKQALFRKISERGVILLLDSDGGGVQIRSFLNSVIPKDRIHNVYIPRVEGKERRKIHASKAGTLGVEGMEREVIERILSPFACESEDTADLCETIAKEREKITKVDFFRDGLSGGANSRRLRDALAAELELPPGMSANALLEAINIITDKDGYLAALERAKGCSRDSETQD